ncbi:abc-type transport system involved in resistance to organic auxiliary component [Lasius niger]|uniref:Abc-type transport system involved in resistance to organic auxiliary component n=1 Tax=Lasius niger TaxID=67767 RepID=A0A0J7N9E3_LASNI|nr:abc-type transport system involved in resistance to organic auxiliary component [Lasius niger]
MPLFLTALTALSLSYTSPLFAAAPPSDPLASGTSANDDDGLGLDDEGLGDPADAAPKKPKAVLLPANAAAPVIDGLYKVLDQAQSATTINQRLSILAPAIQKDFDLNGILVRSVGHGFDALNPADQALLKESFYRYTLAHYASIFKPGTAAVFSVDPEPKIVNPSKLIIHTKIGGENDHGEGTAIDYVMEPEGTQWKVKDVLLEGHISQVAAQRSDFKLPFRDGGAQGLAELLEGKTQTALQGS